MMLSFSPSFGYFLYPYTGLVTIVTILVYEILAVNVGRSRRKHNTPATVTDGPPELMRVFRVHMNSLEQIVVFLPLLWLAALSVSDVFAAAVGIVWPISRILYAAGYYRDAQKRGPGFGLGMLVVLILLIGSAAGMIASL